MKLHVTTNSYRILVYEFTQLYKRIVTPGLPIRQIGISFGNVKDELYEQYDIFTDMHDIEKERHLQQSLVQIRNKFGKNAVLKGISYCDKATALKRNTLIGGHNA